MKWPYTKYNYRKLVDDTITKLEVLHKDCEEYCDWCVDEEDVNGLAHYSQMYERALMAISVLRWVRDSLDCGHNLELVKGVGK